MCIRRGRREEGRRGKEVERGRKEGKGVEGIERGVERCPYL